MIRKVLAGMVVLLAVGAARVDGMMIYPPIYQVTETGQRAVIWYKDGVETLVMSTTFKGNAKDFAWIMPVPGKPEVRAGKDELFTALNDFTTPKSPDNYPQPLGMGMMGAPSGDYSQRVTVYETKRVDIYDVSVLTATDTLMLRKWLTDRGYPYPENREHLLQSYVNRGWYFVAAKVSDTATAYAGNYLKEGHATPLSMTFATNQIVYPLKISGPAAYSTPTPRPSKPQLGKIIGAWSFENGGQGWYDGVLTSQVKAFDGKFVWAMRSEDVEGYRGYAYKFISWLTVGKDYVFSAYVKPEVGAKGWVSLSVGEKEFASKTENLEQIKGWKRLELKFTARGSSVRLNLDGDAVMGKVYWDAVQLEEGEEATPFVNEVMPIQFGGTAAADSVNCRIYDGDVKGCDYTGGRCAYYYCSNQCWPRGTANEVACGDGMIVQMGQAQPVNMVIYVLADGKKTAPGWNTEYAGYIQAKDIERLAVEDSGEPWMEAKGKMYLTKLTRTMRPAEMADDVVFRDAGDNEAVGGGTAGGGGKWRIWVVLGLPLLAEAGLIIYIGLRKRRHG